MLPSSQLSTVDENGCSLLDTAVKGGHEAVALLLLESGADASGRNFSHNLGWTMLHYAARYGRIQVSGSLQHPTSVAFLIALGIVGPSSQSVCRRLAQPSRNCFCSSWPMFTTYIHRHRHAGCCLCLILPSTFAKPPALAAVYV